MDVKIKKDALKIFIFLLFNQNVRNCLKAIFYY